MGKEESKPIEPERIGSEGAELIKSGANLVRLENATQISMAIQHPRQEAVILKQCLAELDLYPRAAEEAIYCKPVGKDPDTGDMKFAEGLSIRAAESIACRWGNSAFAIELTGDDGTVVTGLAIFLDYENNTRRAMAFSVSRKYKSKGGATYSYSEDRFHNTVVPAVASKKLREVILRSLPAGLKIEYETKARMVMEKLAKAGPEKIDLAITSFARLGVSTQQLEKYLGMNIEAARASNDALTKLRGVYEAIKDGETTIEEAFPKDTPATAAAPNGAKGASLASKLSVKVETTEGTPELPDTQGLDLASEVIDRLMDNGAIMPEMAQSRLDAVLVVLHQGRRGKPRTIKIDDLPGVLQREPGLIGAMLDALSTQGW